MTYIDPYIEDLIRQTNEITDLNLLRPASCEGYGVLKESSIRDLTHALIRPVFRNIEIELIEQIHKHDIIVGCVAWLTSIPILEALQGKSVQFVVQQEDWLRPDSDDWSIASQRYLYQSLTGIWNMDAEASYSGCFKIQPIRLSGKPKTKNRSNPRMHHKFVLFGNRRPNPERYVTAPQLLHNGYARRDTFDLLWTGSYNFTANATKSLENGLFVKCPEVIDSYYVEWRQVLLSSLRIEDRWWGKSYGWSSEDEILRDGT
jgi:hypothetical protein